MMNKDTRQKRARYSDQRVIIQRTETRIKLCLPVNGIYCGQSWRNVRRFERINFAHV